MPDTEQNPKVQILKWLKEGVLCLWVCVYMCLIMVYRLNTANSISHWEIETSHPGLHPGTEADGCVSRWRGKIISHCQLHFCQVCGRMKGVELRESKNRGPDSLEHIKYIERREELGYFSVKLISLL